MGAAGSNGNDAQRFDAVDVVIGGGGLAGLLLARQLRRQHPELSVAIVERTSRPLPEACHKVGESSVELGSQYMERLGLSDYLLDQHIVKFGLRFFPGGGQLPLQERTELGPSAEPVVRSYQLDRGRFENDLRGMCQADGVTLYEGARVTDVALGTGDAPHHIAFETDAGANTLVARWFVDATGRNALLRRRLKLKRGTRHGASAGWYRVRGKVDINDLVPDDVPDWHTRSQGEDRWRSTNHFMGPGYWVWVIPLATGNTSIGAIVHDEQADLAGFDEVRTLERLQAFIARQEPQLAAHLEPFEVMDFGCINGYSHNVARSWSVDRWALVGEAGAFVDPLYSPGTDFIAFTNCFTCELIRVDLAGEDLAFRVRELNLQYRALVAGAVDVFRNAGPVYGHARAMAAKIYFDNFAYWCFPCQYFQQQLYRTTGPEHSAFNVVGARFVELSNYVQALMREWALLAPEAPAGGMIALPAFPSLLVDAHLALQDSMTPAQTLAYMQERVVQGAEIVAEIALRIVQELGPDTGRELLTRAGYDSWAGVRVDEARLAAEDLIGLSRRRKLSKVARDVERCLGRVKRHDASAQARTLLLERASA